MLQVVFLGVVVGDELGLVEVKERGIAEREVPVVRSYGVSLDLLKEEYRKSRPVEGVDWIGEQVEEAGFESRLIEKGDELRAGTKVVGEILMDPTLVGAAVYNETKERLVVRTGRREHRILARCLQVKLKTKAKVTAEMYSIPGVVTGKRNVLWRGVPEGGVKLGGVSVVSESREVFKVESEEGGFRLEGVVNYRFKNEGMIRRKEGVVEINLAAGWSGGESQGSFKAGLVLLPGIPLSVELGSKDGVETLVLVVKVDLVLADGSPHDDWIQDEDGSSFLRKERAEYLTPLVREKEHWPAFRRFVVGPGFLNDHERTSTLFDRSEGSFDEFPPLFTGTFEEGEGAELYDVRNMFTQGGLDLKEDELAVFNATNGTVWVTGSRRYWDLIEPVFRNAVCDFPMMVRTDFLLVESDEEISAEGLKAGGFKVLKKVGALGPDWGRAKVALGEGVELEVKVELDRVNEEVEIEASLSKKGVALLQGSFVLENGKAKVVQQSRVGEKWQAWVATARGLTIEGEIGELRVGE